MKGIGKRMFAATLLLGFLGTGCSTMQWMFGDWNYELGDAQRENSEKMIANRDAIDAEAKPVEGTDGQTGEDIMVLYRRDQAQPRSGAPSPSIINIGTSGQ
jgi:hypothetical protein